MTNSSNNKVRNPNVKTQMSNQIQNPNTKFDLEERTSKFGELIIDFAHSIPHTPVNKPLISQIVRSGTSIGANYMEADCAESKKDFRHKIFIAKKECQETKHWLRMIAKANPTQTKECRILWQEAREFTLIFSSIINSPKK